MKFLLSPRYLPRRIQFRHIESFVRGKTFGRVLDIGAGEAPYRKLVKCKEYIVSDIEKKSEETLIANLDEELPLADGSIDLIICTQVLEYVNNPLHALKEIHRVLKNGGTLLLSAPDTWRFHEPHDLHRFTIQSLRDLLEQAGYSKIELREGNGNTYTRFAMFVATMRNPIFAPIIFILNAYARIFLDNKIGSHPLDILGIAYK